MANAQSVTDSIVANQIIYEELPLVVCESNEDCNFHGQCTSDRTECVCDDEYATFPVDSEHLCNYKRKSKLAAFLLQFFLGNGVGHFYVGRISEGMAFFWTVGYGFIVSGCFLGCCIYCICSGIFDSEKSATFVVSCLGVCFILIAFAIWIWLLVQFGRGDITDSNGVTLYNNF